MSSKPELPSYEVISQSENEEATTSPLQRFQFDRKRLRWLILGLILTLAIATTAVFASIKRTQPPAWDNCGDNPSTARSRGCKFDLISFAWQVPPCYDAPLIAEFCSYDDWTFYPQIGPEGLRGNTSIPVEEVLEGEEDRWITWHFHLVHCTFIWRQLHRGFERGWIDSHADNYKHTKHCQKALLRGTGFDEDYTRAPVIYPTCRKLETKGGMGIRGSVYGS